MSTPPPPPPPGSPGGPPGSGPPPPPPAPPGGFPPVPNAGWSSSGPTPAAGLALAAMVLGIIGLPFFVIVIPSLLALIFGLIATSTIKNSGGTARLGMARSGWIMGVIGLVGAAVFYPLVIIFGEETKNVHELEAGDCVTLDFDNQEDVVSDLPVVDCTDTHNGEVIGNVLLNPDRDRDYPSELTLRSEGFQRCAEHFVDYTDQTLNELQFDLYVLYPMESGWRAERGRTTCIAFQVDRSDLDESIAN